MTITTLSSREFILTADSARQATSSGPVFIMDGGRPAHVLITYELYQRLTEGRQTIADLLAMPGTAHMDLEHKRSREPARPADFS